MQNTRDNYNACTNYLHRSFEVNGGGGEVSVQDVITKNTCTNYFHGSFQVDGCGGEVPVQNTRVTKTRALSTCPDPLR